MGYGIWPDTSDQLCSYDPATNQCDYKHYGLEVGFGWLFPGIAIGFIVMVCGCFLTSCYATFRKCPAGCQKFNCLNYLSPETCGGRWFPLSNGWICRAIFCILLILSTLCLLVALGVDVDVNNSTNDFKQESIDFSDDQVDKISNSINKMQATNINQEISSTTKPLFQSARSYIGVYHDKMSNTKYISDVQLAKFITEVVFVFLMICLAVLGVCGACTGIRLVLLLYVMLALLSLFILSLYYSYCIASEALYDDFCHDNDVTLAYGNSALKNGILPCNGSRARTFRSEIDETIARGEDYACGNVNRTCEQARFDCSNITCDLRRIGDLPNEITVLDVLQCGDPNCPPGPCTTTCYSNRLTLAECAVSCRNSDARNASNATQGLCEDAQVFSDQLYNVLFPLLRCEFVREYVIKIDDSLCKGMIRIGIVGLFTLFAVALFVLSIIMAILTHNSIAEHHRLTKEDAYE
eukprot:TRINITY_DN1027_c0_g1_i2.p1 TRINITY_DN1027_c0_g1~~TRINITY_DN1027_c0_g1_i2.p1  ORF type:complete len:490 (+),score=22.80 TRINITY_DN1027_c0_g1_i2:73-1470(+)